MSNTKIKASQFHGVVGHGTDGYFLMTNGDGSMTWVSNIINPTITNVDYPGTATAADPAGGETITLTGTNFKTGATVTIGGTSAPSVSYVSATELTITTPAKTAGDYDIVVTNTDGGSATFVNGISYNGIPAWTTAAGSLGTFASEETISTITLQASEPDAGTITFNITNGALPTGLSLTGANIDGTTSLETADTLYTFTVTATDDENQATPRTFTITVQKEFISTENFTINTYTGTGSTQSIEGKIGTAADFNGSSSGIVIPSPISGTTDYDFSFSTWFNLTNLSVSGNRQFLFGPPASGNEGSIRFEFSGNGSSTDFLMGRNLNGTFYYNNSTSANATLSDNTWYHLAVNYVSSTKIVTVYINGSSVGTQTLSSTTTYTQSNNLLIGKVWNDTLGLEGKIDQLRIFNKALSSSEVTTLYGESNTSTTKSTTDIFDDGSGVALYEFEKGAIDTGGGSGYIGSGVIINSSSSSAITTSLTPPNTFSFSCWIICDNTSTDNIIFGSPYNFASPTNTNHLFTTTGGEIGLGVYGVTAITTSGENVYDGNWHHIVLVTTNANTHTIYVDGNVTSINNISLSFSTLGNISLGRIDTGAKSSHLDQVRIFNKALSSSEVTTLYGETSSSTTKSTTDIFDDGSGVALYELEGNANDTGDYPYGTGAIDSGQSAVFNGSSSVITPSTAWGLSYPFSVSTWVNTDWSSDDGQIINLNIGGTRVSALYKINSQASWGNLGVFFGQSNHWTYDLGTDYNNKWVHIAATFSSANNFTLYVNGSSVTPTNNGGSHGGSAANAIGANGTGSEYLDGKLDDVRIYSDVLTSTEIGYIVNNDTVNIPTGNLVAHYKLDGNANDETTSYNGTASNVTYTDPAEFPHITYNGTATNVSYAYDGTPTNVGFVGTSFAPDLVWVKIRTQPFHNFLFDSLRIGNGTSDYHLVTNDTGAEGTVGELNQRITSFNSYGYTLGGGGQLSNINKTGENYVAWAWKAGGVPTPNNNTQGTITSTVSANQDAGFSIVKYRGNGNAESVGHGLSSAPEMIIVKSLGIEDWFVYFGSTSTPADYMKLNSTVSAGATSAIFPSPPTSTVFNQGGGSGVGANNVDHIAYCFHSVDGYQKIGSYTGTGAVNNQINVGFQPRFVMQKRTDSSGSWNIIDNQRGDDNYLSANLSNAEGSMTASSFHLTSTGFTLDNSFSEWNASGGTYIYLAIA